MTLLQTYEESISLVIIFLVIVLMTVIAMLPAVGWALYLSLDRSMLRQNTVVGIFGALAGALIGMLFYEQASLSPSAQVYGLVGAWIGGSLAVIMLAVIRFIGSPQTFRIRRSLKSWFIVLSLLCVALALVAFLWRH